MHLRRQASQGQRTWGRGALPVALAGGGITAVLFAALHHTLGSHLLLAGASGALAAWASHFAVRQLIGARRANPVTLWLMLATVVLALAPVALLQVYAAVCVVAIWTLCIAFQDVLR